jgi:hypothetical protein
MKIVILIAVSISVLLVACNEKTADRMKGTNEEKKDTVQQMNYPYKAAYSSDMSMGKPEHVTLVLNMFKAWEEGRMDDMRPMLADSISVNFSDGSRFNGTADSLLKMGKQMRANYTSLRTELDAFMPVHLNDKNEDYVLVWGRDYTTDKSGKVDSTDGHSFWQIVNNKICLWSEYSKKIMPAMPPPPPAKNNP